MNKNCCVLALMGAVLITALNADETPPALSSATTSSVKVPNSDSRREEIQNLLKQGQQDKAIQDAERWIASDKKAAEPWALLAEINFQKKQYKKALSLGEKALSRNAGNAEAYFWRGRSYEAMKNWLEAANEYRAALLSDPGFTEATEGLNRVKTSLSLPQMDARQTGSDGHP